MPYDKSQDSKSARKIWVSQGLTTAKVDRTVCLRRSAFLFLLFIQLFLSFTWMWDTLDKASYSGKGCNIRTQNTFKRRFSAPKDALSQGVGQLSVLRIQADEANALPYCVTAWHLFIH